MKKARKKNIDSRPSSSAAKKPVRKPRIGEVVAAPGNRKAIFTRATDSSGKTADHFRIIDTLGTMLRKGTINVAMYDAATLFGSDFHAAGLLGVRSIDYSSVGGEATGSSTTEKAALASHRVHKALSAVGGIGSVSGSFLWHVVGEGLQLNEWASSTPWNNRHLNKDEARGVAISALQSLAAHYGYQPKERKRKFPD